MNDRLLGLLGQVFDRVREGKPPEGEDVTRYEQRKFEFAFHLTDWVTDLDQLQSVLKAPNEFDVETASNVIVAFLVHAVPHLNAAGRLLLDEIGDPFVDGNAQNGDDVCGNNL